MANATERWLPIVSDGQGELIAVAGSAGELQGTVTGPEYDAGLWNSSGLTAHSHSFNPARWGVSGGIDTISTFRNRQYDPSTGKWLQEDPIGTAGGVNLYQYNGNDPNSFGDPFGLGPCKPAGSCIVAGIARGAAIGAALGIGANTMAAVVTGGGSLVQAPVSVAGTVIVGVVAGGSIGAAQEVASILPSIVPSIRTALNRIKIAIATGVGIRSQDSPPKRPDEEPRPPLVKPSPSGSGKNASPVEIDENGVPRMKIRP